MDGMAIDQHPVDALLGETIAATITPENGKPVVVTGAVDARRGAFLLRAEGLPSNTVCRYTVTVGDRTVGPFHFVTAVPPDSGARRETKPSIRSV